MPSDGLPSSDLELALQLQREDLEALKEGRKGKAREGEADDLAFARQLDEIDLMAATLRAEGEQAALDRELARRLSSEGVPRTPATRVPAMPAPDEELRAQLEALYLSPQEPVAESSTRAASRPVPRTRRDEQPMIDCGACGDEHHPSGIFRCPCSH